jgi:hypothetical protein
MEHENQLLHSLEPANEPYPDVLKFTPILRIILFYYISFNTVDVQAYNNDVLSLFQVIDQYFNSWYSSNNI